MKYLTCDIATGGPTCQGQVLKNFATRAWRRPVQDAELTAYTALAAAQPTPQHRLADHQLASRLSYFLWASMPDDQLFTAAESGGLATDAGLRAQITRLLGN